MLRQRNTGAGAQGIFIGDVEEPLIEVKEKKIDDSKTGCWKHLSFILGFITGCLSEINSFFIIAILILVVSVLVNAYHYWLIQSYEKNIVTMTESQKNLHSEWTADRSINIPFMCTAFIHGLMF